MSAVRLWTKDDCILEAQEWEVVYGRPPGRLEWSQRRPHRGTRPSATTCIRLFGTWTAFIEAAGFTPRPKGFPLDMARTGTGGRGFRDREVARRAGRISAARRRQRGEDPLGKYATA